MRETKVKSVSGIGLLTAYFLIFVVWGSTYYFIGAALKGLSLFLLGALRFSIAGLFLLIWCWYRGESIFRKSLIKKSAFSGIVLLFVDMAIIMLAQRYVSSSLVAIVASSTAIWIMALDIPMWKTNFQSLRKIVGIFTDFIGVSLLYAEQFFYDASFNENKCYGIILLIFGCFSWAIGTLYTKYRLVDTNESNAFSGSAWQMLFAGAVFWIFALFTGELSETDWVNISSSSWLALVYLILFGSIMAYSAYVWLLQIRPAAEVGTHAYVNPIVAILIGAGIGKEKISVLQIVGLAVILLSMVLIRKVKGSKNLQ